MKKRFFVYLTLFAVIFACSDDFTDVPAIGALSDQTLQNEAGVDLLLVGAYSTLDGIRNGGSDPWHGTGDNWWLDALSDDAHKGSTDGDQADLFLLETYDWTTGNPYLNIWNSRYAGVNRANAVIDLIAKLEAAGGDPLPAKTAESRFLRGHYNFDLQKIFGNPPYISEENFANSEFNQANSGPIWDQIEADFQFAVDNLPTSQADVGRPTSWAAKAYLAKAHMYQGEYSAALPILTDIVNNGPYALLANFADNFRLAGENGSESIFAIQYTSDSGNSFNGNLGGTLNFPNALGFCCGFFQPTQDLVNAYQTDGTGLPLLDTFNQTDVTNDHLLASSDPFTPHTGPLDPRLDYTVGRRGLDYNGYGLNPGQDWVRATNADISGPYLPKKNVYQNGESGNQGTGVWGQQSSGINYHILRYADVLLMAAEAEVEVGSLETARGYVNEVRNRAKNSAYLQNEAGTADAANYQIEPYTVAWTDAAVARNAVRFERRLELAMEGHRFFDLVRWGVAESVISAYVTNETRTIDNFGPKVGTFSSPTNNILPIPINAIDLSGGVIQQNPGY